MYLHQVEGLLARVHPGITSVRVGPGDDRDTLAVTLTGPPDLREEILAALARSEPSLRPGGWAFAYRYVAASAADGGVGALSSVPWAPDATPASRDTSRASVRCRDAGCLCPGIRTG